MNARAPKPEALIIDLDGTLFKTETLSLPAYHAAFNQLRSEGLYTGETPPEERFLSSLGLLLPEIWARVIPDTSEQTRARADELLLFHQLRLLKQGLGELYPGVQSTLEALHGRGHRLFVASNGLESYVKEVVHHQGIDRLFTALYSAGEYQTSSKVQLVRLLLDTYHIEAAWMCGDRSSDVEAGAENGLYVVGCSYGGFHQAEELKDADVVITAFPELLDNLDHCD